MACNEITKAIAWNHQTSNSEVFPVRAYFTRHVGLDKEPPKAFADICTYGVGSVSAVDTPTPHLAGELQYYGNGGSGMPSPMTLKPTVTYAVKIFPDGTVSFQQKLNGNPVGGMAPITRKLTCLDNMLLSGVVGADVVSVGVRREPPIATPS
jgi:hypothetical protein